MTRGILSQVEAAERTATEVTSSEGDYNLTMAAGLLPGKEKAPKPDKPNMSRMTALAGQTVVQETKAGRFAVTYDEKGYAVKAMKQ